MTHSKLSTGVKSMTFVVTTKLESIPRTAPLSGEVMATEEIVAASPLPPRTPTTSRAARSTKHFFIIVFLLREFPPRLENALIILFSIL